MMTIMIMVVEATPIAIHRLFDDDDDDATVGRTGSPLSTSISSWSTYREAEEETVDVGENDVEEDDEEDDEEDVEDDDVEDDDDADDCEEGTWVLRTA